MSPAQKTHILEVLQQAKREVGEAKTFFHRHKTSCVAGDCCSISKSTTATGTEKTKQSGTTNV